jgi:hypothetical protein
MIIYLVRAKQPAFLLTPTPLRWSTLSPPLAQRGLGKEKKNTKEKITKPSLPLAVESVVERSNDRVSLRSRIQ